MTKLLRAIIFLCFFNNLVAQPLRFFDTAYSVKYTSLDVAGDDKGGWLTLGSREDSSFNITQFDYCGEIIVNEKYPLPLANSKLNSPQIFYTGKDTAVVIGTLTTANISSIIIFYSVGGIISKARGIASTSTAVNHHPVISRFSGNHILLGFNSDTGSLASGKIVMLDRNLNVRWTRTSPSLNQIHWIKTLDRGQFAVGELNKVALYDTLGANIWSRTFPELNMVYNSVLRQDSQLIFLADYIKSDTTLKENYKQVIGLDLRGKLKWHTDLIRSMRNNYLLENNSRLFFNQNQQIIFNAIDTVQGDSIPSLFAHSIDANGKVINSIGWSANDSVIDYKSSLTNDGNYGIGIILGTADTIKGFANVKSTGPYEGACNTLHDSVLVARSVVMDSTGTRNIQTSVVFDSPWTITGKPDTMTIDSLCEIFDLKSGEVPISLCKGDSVFLSGFTDPNATYDWENGSKSPGIWVKEEGKYKVTITYCERTVDITYNVTFKIFSDQTFDYMMCDFPDNLYAFQGPDVNGASYLWDDNSTGPSRQITGPGTYKVTVSYCMMTFVQTFNITRREFHDQLYEYKMCDFPATLYAFQGPDIKGATYKWDDNSTGGSRQITGPGTYKVTVNYCNTSFVETNIVEYRKFDNSYFLYEICDFPQPLYAFQGPDIKGATYRWDLDGSTESFLLIEGPGIYKVTVKYCNSEFIETNEVKYRTIPASDSTKTDSCNNFPITLNAFSDENPIYKDLTYKWSTPNMDITKSVQVGKIGEYYVDIDYCNQTFRQTFTVKEAGEDYLLFPNVFPPTGEEANKIFKPFIATPDNTIMTDYKLEVYNRWGQRVFTSTELIKGWDGNYKGELAPMETYMFIATIQTSCGGIKGWKGTVTLVR